MFLFSCEKLRIWKRVGKVLLRYYLDIYRYVENMRLSIFGVGKIKRASIKEHGGSLFLLWCWSAFSVSDIADFASVLTVFSFEGPSQYPAQLNQVHLTFIAECLQWLTQTSDSLQSLSCLTDACLLENEAPSKYQILPVHQIAQLLLDASILLRYQASLQRIQES